MAGLNGTTIEGATEGPVPGGIFSPLARAQYAALARLRWQIFSKGIRTNRGALELSARIFAFVMYAGLGFGMCAGAAASTYALVDKEMWGFLPLVFWGACFIWQIVPIMMSSLQDQFDQSILLRFPVSFGSYVLLYLIFGIADASTLLGCMCCSGIFIGVALARPDLLGWTTLALPIFAAFNILLARAIFAWIDRWLAQRKTREILGGIFMIAMLSLQLLNPAFHNHRGRRGPDSQQQMAQRYLNGDTPLPPWLRALDSAQQWLPPGLAAVALRRAATGLPSQSIGLLGVLGIYMFGIGNVLAVRLRAEYRGESLGEAPGRKKTPVKGEKVRREGARILGGSGPIGAVIEKELRAMLRSMPLLYSIGAPLILVVIFSGGMSSHGAHPHAWRLALPACLIYAQIGFTRLFYNNLGTEGQGIQLFFLSPTPIRTLMLAKNIFHSMLFCLSLAVAATLATFRLGSSDADVVAATIAWLVFALPCNLAAGNIFSITMPYRVNLGRITRQRGGQGNALLSLLAQFGMLAVSAVVFGACMYLGKIWLAVPIFLALGAIAIFVWLRVLSNSDALANSHRDLLISTLMKTE